RCGAGLRVVLKPADQVAAGGGCETTACRLEAERGLVLELDRQAVRDSNVGPRVRIGERHGFHLNPNGAHLVPALNDQQPVAEKGQASWRPVEKPGSAPDAHGGAARRTRADT